MKNKRQKDLMLALLMLTKWATGGDKSGNPYRHEAVKVALKALKAASGKPDGDYFDGVIVAENFLAQSGK